MAVPEPHSRRLREDGRSGLYIHVPFCRRRCPFCDFAVTTDLKGVEAYLAALEREMDLRAGSWDLLIDTVYLGGGTPSVLEPGMVARILNRARSRFGVLPDPEVTLEANPGNLGPGDFGLLLEAGVNRLSLGIQSFDDGALAFLGRDHTVGDSIESFRRARAEGFRNISIDLLYGRPGLSREAWALEIERARELDPEHISAYQLTHEHGTPMTRKVEQGQCGALSDAEAQDFFIFTRERLEAAGYYQHEISSFPRSPEYESRHNRKYWEGAPYLGLGPSAHSYRDPERWWNVPRLPSYLEALGLSPPAAGAAPRDPAEGREVLGPEERRLERIFLGLRTTRGIDLESFREEFGEDLPSTCRRTLEVLLEGSLAVLGEGFLRLSPRGLALADEIALDLAERPAHAGA